MAHPPLRGILFDLDGTLVESGLDFDAIRREMGLEAGTPILEALSQLEPDEVLRCREVLARHEEEGARRARPMPGAVEFVRAMAARGVHQAVITRNARQLAFEMLASCQIEIERVVAREDGPIKPDPASIETVCGEWGIEPSEAVMIGDFVFDLEAGRRAGARTVLYTQGRDPQAVRGAELADYHLVSFEDANALLASLFDSG